MKNTLKHAYVREGAEWPLDPLIVPVHIEVEDEGTALHVWWLESTR